MKNLKFTFWLIGFGCGIVVSGIVGTLFTINLEAHETKSEPSKLEAKQLNEGEEEANTDTGIKLGQTEEIKKEKGSTNISEQILQENHDEVSTASTLKVIEKKYCEIEIPKNVSAMEICYLLEQNNIIENKDTFLEYIKRKKMQGRLRAGKIKFPVLGEEEEVLNALISN